MPDETPNQPSNPTPVDPNTVQQTPIIDPMPATEPVAASATAPAPAPMASPIAASAPAGYSQPAGTGSSSGVNGPFPAELAGWNWGAFFLNIIWGIAHNVWISLICLIPYVGFIMPFVLGFKGNEWAWQHRKFENVEQFRTVQKAWTKWGIGVFIVSIILSIIYAVVMFFILGALIGGGDFDTEGLNGGVDTEQSIDGSAQDNASDAATDGTTLEGSTDTSNDANLEQSTEVPADTATDSTQ